MNKTDLVSVLAAQLSTTVSQSREIVKTVISIITKKLEGQETVTLYGFGKFSIEKSSNGSYVKFRAAKSLNRRIRGG